MSVETRLNLDDIVEIGRQFRLQWEQAQQAYVLLYPEGMVKLSQSAGEILKRIDGKLPIADVVKNLEQAFPGANLQQDVLKFLEVAYERGWIHPKQAS
ncbi:MAG TPA: pyrroloquinoline quinone biosynthesis peptide chaperone PqqD [Burkholderiales bacterium]|jgi:pyrroloquinoline quinone biosynthesis protein D|nr:pyrroloquinoline quinone biosynthesis peptide chaperone PqqD [Burkholderiales bacterium]